EKQKYFSFTELRPGYEEIGKQAERIEKIQSEKRSTFEKQLMKLYSGLELYQRLKISLRPPMSDDFAAELKDYQQVIAPGVTAVRASQAGQTFDQKAYDRILEFLS